MFLRDSLCNQKKKIITTDLKKEYQRVLDFMKVPQQYCLFHVKQKINRDIKTYINQNIISEEKNDVLLDYKYIIFDLLNADDIYNVKQRKFNLISKYTNIANVIKNHE